MYLFVNNLLLVNAVLYHCCFSSLLNCSFFFSYISMSQMKQYRFDLQRAVNTPINAISGLDSHHLRDKLHRLLALLRGQEVKVSGRSVRVDRTPEALLFCQNLVAKMLVVSWNVKACHLPQFEINFFLEMRIMNAPVSM